MPTAAPPQQRSEDSKPWLVVVQGSSMSPTLQSGDAVWAQQNIEPRVGDIIVTPFIVHRLIAIDPLGGYWHCGDHPRSVCARVGRDDIEGTVLHRFDQSLIPNPWTSYQVFRRMLVWGLGRMRR